MNKTKYTLTITSVDYNGKRMQATTFDFHFVWTAAIVAETLYQDTHFIVEIVNNRTGKMVVCLNDYLRW